MTANRWFLVGLVASVLSGIGAAADVFPTAWKPYVLLASIIGASVTGYMAKSPFPHPEGQ